MKSNYKKENEKITISKSEIKKIVNEEFQKKFRALEVETVKNTAEQMLSALLYVLEMNYGFKRKRLAAVKQACENVFILMNIPNDKKIQKQDFNAYDIKSYLETKYKINLEIEVEKYEKQ